ncbi:uncharacterized protein LOC144250815 [Urocitellus parryii]
MNWIYPEYPQQVALCTPGQVSPVNTWEPITVQQLLLPDCAEALEEPVAVQSKRLKPQNKRDQQCYPSLRSKATGESLAESLWKSEEARVQYPQTIAAAIKNLFKKH